MTSDNDEKLDPMALLEEAMRHSHWKASLGIARPVLPSSDRGQRDTECSADRAEIASFRHPKISAESLLLPIPMRIDRVAT